MRFKHRLNILIFCLYLGTIGRYFLKQLFETKLIETTITLIINIIIFLITVSFIKSSSKYLIFLILFILSSTISFLISDNNLMFAHFNGTREIFIFFCYFIIFDEIYKWRQIEYLKIRFSTFAHIFLAMQIPLSILQFIKYGPGDLVGGTFEVGGSGMLTLTIFLLVFYLIVDKNYINNYRYKKGAYLIVFLIPTALNETKITFVLIFLFFLSFFNFKNIRTNIILGIVGVLSVVIFSYLYSTNESVQFNNPLEGLTSRDFLEKYFMGDEDINNNDVPRFTKFTISLNKLYEDGDLYFGKDYGAFMFNNSESRSEFSRRYNWLLIGSLPFGLYLFITGGLFLLILICYIIFMEIFNKYNGNLRINSLPLLVFSTSIFVIILFYNDAFRSPVFSFIFIFILFYSKRYIKRNDAKRFLK